MEERRIYIKAVPPALLAWYPQSGFVRPEVFVLTIVFVPSCLNCLKFGAWSRVRAMLRARGDMLEYATLVQRLW